MHRLGESTEMAFDQMLFLPDNLYRFDDGRGGIGVGDDCDFDFDVSDDFDFDFDFDYDEGEDEENQKSRSTEDSHSSGGTELSSLQTRDQRKGNYRRKRNRRRRLFAPRIVKNDVRRHYATMMANVCNSFDNDTYASFFTTFSVPNLRIRKDASLELPTSPCFQQAFRQDNLDDIHCGVQWLVLCFSVIQRLSPDNTMRIISSQLRTRSDTCKTLLSMKVRFDFTRFHNVHPMVFAEAMFVEALGEAESKANVSPTTRNVTQPSPPPDLREWTEQQLVHPCVYFKNKVGTDIPRLDTPQAVAFTSTIHFYIDEYKRIEMIELADQAFA